MLKMGEIKMKELGRAAKVLNDSGLIEQKIKIIGQPKDKLINEFIEAVKTIPGGANAKACPDAVSEYYKLIMPKDVKPLKKEKASGEPKPLTQTDFIRGAIKKKVSRENLLKNLVDVFGKDEGWAKKRMAVYEKAYGAMGKDDHIMASKEA